MFKQSVKMKNLTALLTIAALIFSCSYKPILNQNQHYIDTGEESAEAEIDRCDEEASTYLKKYKARRAAKQALRKGTWGALFGGVFGFLIGGNVNSLAKGVAIGAAIGAATGALGVAGEGKISPDEIKQRYVTQCLASEGYEVIGWE